MSGGSRVTKTETSPWGVMPGAEGDTFEFGGQTYPSSMISPGGAFPQGLGQLPQLTGAFEAARNLYTGGQFAPSYFPSQTYAGFDPAQQAAQEAITGYATGGTPDVLSAAAQAGLVGGIDYGLGRMQRGQDLAQPLTQAQYAGLTPFDEGQYGGLLSGEVDYTAGPFGEMASAYRSQAEDQMQKALANVRGKQVLYQPGGGSRGDIFAAQSIEQSQKDLNRNLASLYGGAYSKAQAARLPAAQALSDQQAADALAAQQAADAQAASDAILEQQRQEDERIRQQQEDAIIEQQRLDQIEQDRLEELERQRELDRLEKKRLDDLRKQRELESLDAMLADLMQKAREQQEEARRQEELKRIQELEAAAKERVRQQQLADQSFIEKMLADAEEKRKADLEATMAKTLGLPGGGVGGAGNIIQTRVIDPTSYNIRWFR